VRCPFCGTDDTQVVDSRVNDEGNSIRRRPVPVEYIEQAIERIIQKVLAYGEKEITARELGENVMHELKKMDKVAYIRFASVYRSFSDVEDFHDVIRDLD